MKFFHSLIHSVLLLSAMAVGAQELHQPFEAISNDHFLPVGGKNSAGSTIEVSTERAYQGQKAAKIQYKFSDSGFIELHSARPREAVTNGERLYVSLWVYGAGQTHFGSAALRLLDAEGEVFQYRLPADMSAALGGTGWREVRAEIDLTKPAESWGAKKNSVREMPMRFLGFGFTRAGAEPISGTFFLDELRLSTQPIADVKPTANAPKLALEPEQVGTGPQLYFYKPGTVAVRLKLDNAPDNASLRWSARDFAGQILAQGTLSPAEARAGTLRITATRPGIVYVAATLLGAKEEALAEAEARFAILQPRAVAAKIAYAPLPILYGACAHLLGKSPADAEREVALMSALGFRACRFDHHWSNVQPQRDVWKWDNTDRIYGLFEKYRIAPLPILAYTARWATTGDPNAKDWHQWNNAPPVTEHYVRFAQESAKRYGRLAKHWEIWNEPDIAFWLGTAEQYAEMFDAAKVAIKQVQPDALVMNGGFSETKRRPDFIPTWQKTSKQQPDIFAYHSHMAFSNMLRAGEHVKEYMTGANWKMPVWLNEAGFSSVGGLSERDQAIALVKKMSYAPALNFTGYFWYDIRNDGTDRNEGEHNFGLVRHDFTPKAAAVAAHTLQGALQGRRFVRRLTVPGVPQAYALLYEAPGMRSSTLVLWNETADIVPLFWRVPGGLSGIAMRTSLMGEQRPLQVANRLVQIPAAPEPVFVHFSGPAEQLTIAGRLLEFNSPLVAAPGDAVSSRITLRNPLNQPLRGTLALRAGGGWKVATPSIEFEVSANGSREVPFTLTAPATLANLQELQFTVTSPSLPSGATARAQLQTAAVAPRRADAGMLGDFTKWTTPLATLGKAQTVSLFEATPMRELQFHGDDDLSAQVHLAGVPQGLLLAVRVRDNVFHQNEEAGSEWRGDSLQWSLALPTGEHYEWLAALTKNGPVARLILAPPGTPTGVQNLPISVRREGNETLYEVIVPNALPGSKTLPGGFTFSLLVNDNDGAGRKGWVEWTPGIGRTKDPTLFQPLVIR